MKQISFEEASRLVLSRQAGYISSPRLSKCLPIVHRQQTVFETPDACYLCTNRELRLQRKDGVLQITGSLMSASAWPAGAVLLQELIAAGYPTYTRIDGVPQWLLSPRLFVEDRKVAMAGGRIR